MDANDTFLLHRARNLAITLDEVRKPAEAAVVTELADRLEKAVDYQSAPNRIDSFDHAIIKRDVFHKLIETTDLFNFLIDNIGRLSCGVEGDRQDPKFTFHLNPPGRRQQFLREDVIKALMDVREALKTPQYG